VKGNINIVIKDDGVGFDHSWNRTSGFGLFNIRERVKYFGGSLKVKSVPGQGTQVTLSMPSRLKKEKFSRKGH